MATMKYEIPLLDRSTRFLLWQVMMHIVLAHMDLDEVLLGLDNMSLSLTKEGKEHKDRKALRFTFTYQIRFCKTFYIIRQPMSYG